MSLLMLAPAPYFTALDSNGDPISGALVYSISSGGTWPGDALATFSDANGLVPNTNPVVCDAAGRCAMWLSAATYKLIICTAAGAVVRTIDGIAAGSTYDANVDVGGTAGEALAARDMVYLSEGSGGKTAGRWYKTDADDAYASSTAGLMGIAPGAISSGETGSIRLQGRLPGFTGLTPGAPYYVSAVAGGITASAPANKRRVGTADLSTSLVVQPTYSDAADSTARAGGIAITSQAAGDVIYAASATQLGRLAKAAGFLQSDGSAAPTLDPTLRAYSETKTAPAIAAGVLTLNLLLGNHFQVALNANITTLTISNIPASGKGASFVLVLVADGTPRTAAWGAAVKWAYGVTPTLTSTNGKADIFSFLSYDGGTTWWGFVMGQNHG